MKKCFQLGIIETKENFILLADEKYDYGFVTETTVVIFILEI